MSRKKELSSENLTELMIRTADLVGEEVRMKLKEASSYVLISFAF